MDRFCNL